MVTFTKSGLCSCSKMDIWLTPSSSPPSIVHVVYGWPLLSTCYQDVINTIQFTWMVLITYSLKVLKIQYFWYQNILWDDDRNYRSYISIVNVGKYRWLGINYNFTVVFNKSLFKKITIVDSWPSRHVCLLCCCWNQFWNHSVP